MALFSAILQPENTYIPWYARIFRLCLVKNIFNKFGWFIFEQSLAIKPKGVELQINSTPFHIFHAIYCSVPR
jgi:hypothetical protein